MVSVAPYWNVNNGILQGATINGMVSVAPYWNVNYFFVNIDKFKKENIPLSMFIRVVRVATSMNYNNKIKHMNWKDISELMNISARELKDNKKCLSVENDIIKTDEEGNIILSDEYIKKGDANFTKRTIVFAENLNKVYERIKNTKHKRLGKIIYHNKEKRQFF